MIPEDCVGSVSYRGKLTEEGTIDTHSAVRALSGIEKALQFFAAQDEPAFRSIELPIPIRSRKGSWENLIPHDVGSWIMTAAGIAGSAYLTTAASKLAENGFKDETLGSLLKKALVRMQRLLALGKHLGHLDFSKMRGVAWDTVNGQAAIPNDKGETLLLPDGELKRLLETPPTILADVAKVVEDERSLVVSVRDGGAETTEELRRPERHIFAPDDKDEDEPLFPELTHGLPVELSGVVTRENGRARTLGFLYKGHVLSCIPASGDMLPFKKNLFLQCQISGRITRANKDTGLPTEKRPKIIFTTLLILSDREQAVMDFIDDSEA